MNLSYLSVCSGIEAATVAWHELGWEPWAFAQFDPEHKYSGGPDFASAVLKTHYPDVPNLGDMTKFEEWPDAVFDVLAGGTPCQSYSVAGLRKGLDDPRGDLMLTYVAIARRYRPRWVAWENVPGVLSDDGGRSFGTLLGLLTGRIVEVPSGGWETAGAIEGYKSAYGIAWRVIDSQFVRVDGFGRAVPQRRRRVFVVGYLGDYRRAAAVLFERESVCGNSAPRRREGQGFAADVVSSLVGSGRGVERAGETRGQDPVIAVPAVANPLTARMHKGVNTTMDEGQTMIGEVYAPITFNARQDPIFSGETALPLDSDGTTQAIAFDSKASGRGGFGVGQISPTLRAMSADTSHQNGGGQVAVAFQPRFARNGRGAPDEIASALTGEAGRTGKGDSAQCVAFVQNSRSEVCLVGGDGAVVGAIAADAGMQQQHYIAQKWTVRRLMPVECERLQGFPDGYTNVPWRGKNGAPDGPRYRALGNSMSVNVMRWLGRRIEMVEKLFPTAA